MSFTYYSMKAMEEKENAVNISSEIHIYSSGKLTPQIIAFETLFQAIKYFEGYSLKNNETKIELFFSKFGKAKLYARKTLDIFLENE